MRGTLLGRLLCITVAAALVPGVFVPTAGAGHGARYHWERSSNPFTLRILDSTTSPWGRFVRRAARDWRRSPVVRTRVVNRDNDLMTRWRCPAPWRAVRVCNAQFGQNGAIGWIELWLDGRHVQRARVIFNDTYADHPDWDKPRIRRHVACHELGHILGLNHRNRGDSCLNHTVSIRVRSPRRPDRHDYRELRRLYRHLDGGASGADAGTSPRHRGPATHVRVVLPAS